MNQPTVFVTYDLFRAVLKEEGVRRNIANKFGCSEGSVQRIRKVKDAVDALDTAELKRVCERDKLPKWALEFGKREIKRRKAEAKGSKKKEEERKAEKPVKKGFFDRFKKNPVPAEPVEKTNAVSKSALPNAMYDFVLRDLIGELITSVNGNTIETQKSLDDVLQTELRNEKLLTDIKDILVRIEYNTRNMK